MNVKPHLEIVRKIRLHLANIEFFQNEERMKYDEDVKAKIEAEISSYEKLRHQLILEKI